MDKGALEKRIQDIMGALKQKESEIFQLNGHLNEAKYILETIFKLECEANPKVAAVADAVKEAVPVVETVIPVAEKVVEAVEGASSSGKS